MDTLTRDLTRLADGDRSAFDPVWAAAWPRVQALTKRLLGSGPDADDAAQQAMVNVFRRAPEYEPTLGAALPWILGVTTWECRTVRKRTSRRREGALPETLTAATNPERDLIDADLYQALDAVLAELSDTDQQTLLAAIGRRNRPDIPDTTFRKRLQRAMSRLRTAWGKSHG